MKRKEEFHWWLPQPSMREREIEPLKPQQELTPTSIEQGKPGDRFTIAPIEEEEFQERAKALVKEAKERGLDIGTVYHRPIKTGIVFLKKPGREKSP